MSRPSAQTIFAESFFRVNAQLFAPFLAEAGLDERILHTPDVEIPAANYVELWEILGRRVDASIGLRIGIQTVSTALGAYGQTIRSAPTMLLALRCMSHFAVVFAHAIRVDFEIDGGRSSCLTSAPIRPSRGAARTPNSPLASSSAFCGRSPRIRD